MPFKKLLSVTIFLLLGCQLYAQRINGRIIDAFTKLPVVNATISTSNTTVYSNTTGKFSLINTLPADTALITKNGYQSYPLTFSRMGSDTIIIYLQRTSLVLNPVNVRAKRNAQADSLKNRKAFASVFAYKNPTIKDAFIPKASLAYIPTNNIDAPNNTTSLVGINLLSVAKLFRKNKAPVSRLQKTLLRNEELNYVDRYFSAQKISSITGLKGDSLLNFIDTYRPSVSQTKLMTEYEMILYIKNCYAEYIKPKKSAADPAIKKD